MLSFIPGPIRGVLSLLLMAVNTVVIAVIIVFGAAAKLLIPLPSWQRHCGRFLNTIASLWIQGNNLNMRLLQKITWEVEVPDSLNRDSWYLVLCNHQSWVDILVLQKVFHGRIPFLKFFLKKELIWIPFLGAAWWALDFPFMKRYSRRYIERNPHLKGRDLAVTKRACAKFSHIPVSIMNFVEGTRFTERKHTRQDSPYANLLKPKAGGIAFVLGAMGNRLDNILNVTIVYPGPNKRFWDLLTGKIDRIKVFVELLPVDTAVIEGYFSEAEHKEPFHEWVNSLWQEKDRTIDEMRTGA